MSDEAERCPGCEGRVIVYWDDAFHGVRASHEGEPCEHWRLAVLLTSAGKPEVPTPRQLRDSANRPWEGDE